MSTISASKIAKSSDELIEEWLSQKPDVLSNKRFLPTTVAIRNADSSWEQGDIPEYDHWIAVHNQVKEDRFFLKEEVYYEKFF